MSCSPTLPETGLQICIACLLVSRVEVFVSNISQRMLLLHLDQLVMT